MTSLHWGYWKNRDAINLENLKKAQTHYTKKLAKMIPDDVRQILDVGCGIGDNASYLVNKGYDLTCISPEIKHQAALRKIVNGQAAFQLTGIEDYSYTGEFDLALMSESSNYFDADIGFTKLQNLVRKEGYILSTSIFRRAPTKKYLSFHIENDWVASAKAHGFEVVERIDITEQALPNVALMKSIVSTYIIPTAELFGKYVSGSKGIKARTGSFFLNPSIKHMVDFFNNGYGGQMSNPDLFRKHASYIFYLLKNNS